MMTWETVWNISKLLGTLLAFGTVIILGAKVWSSTTKDKVIEILQVELRLAREHSDQCDKTVLHYRDEMHDVRRECTAKVIKAQEVEVENASLKAKTDLSPVMETMTEFILEQRKFTEQQLESNKKQAQINTQVLEALQKLTPKI